MVRIATLALLVMISVAAFACGGDDDSASATPKPGTSEAASNGPTGDSSGSPSPTAVIEAWTGELSGAVTGNFTNTLQPQCGADENNVAVTIQGLVNGETFVVTIYSGGPGTFVLGNPADESPMIDVATSGESPAEWFAAAGSGGEGELILENDGSGSADITLPTIVTGNQEDITLTANWTCPAVTPSP